MNQYSITSNPVKLLKHLDRLQDIQNGKIAPIMVHFAPTHKCQLNCVHCCFGNRGDNALEWEYADFVTAIDQLTSLKVKALEFTGGGDPTLWTHINQGIRYAKDRGLSLGFITNGIATENVEDWGAFDWVRISLNTLEQGHTINLAPIMDLTAISACYIYHSDSDMTFKEVSRFATEHNLPVRITVDCTGNSITELLEEVTDLVKIVDNPLLQVSAFNIDPVKMERWDCRIHMIKPMLYTDGYLYSCPSAELAPENNRQIHDSLRLCHFTEIVSFYKSFDAQRPKGRTCSYCKYAQQNDLLQTLLTPTQFNKFV